MERIKRHRITRTHERAPPKPCCLTSSPLILNKKYWIVQGIIILRLNAIEAFTEIICHKEERLRLCPCYWFLRIEIFPGWQIRSGLPTQKLIWIPGLVSKTPGEAN